jgi:hypothetical protein
MTAYQFAVAKAQVSRPSRVEKIDEAATQL